MADYKDIIAGTLNALSGKVKEVAQSGTVRGIYEQGASRAKAFGQLAKLTLSINGDTEELKRVYIEIGKLYYEQAKDAPEGFFAPLFSQLESIKADIADKQAQIDELKALATEASVPDIDVEVTDFDSVVDATEQDGRNEE